MSSAIFSRTMRSLKAARFRRSNLVLLLVLLLLGGWGAWFWYSSVTIVAVTQHARVEVDKAVHVVQAPLTGRVVKTSLVLSKKVKAGAVLLELDSEPQRLELAEARVTLSVIAKRLSALKLVVVVEQRVLDEMGDATKAIIDEMKGRLREARISFKLANEVAKRWKILFAKRLIAEVEYLRARTDARKYQSETNTLRLSVTRLRRERQQSETSQRSRIVTLKRDLSRINGELTSTRARIARLNHEIERRKVRAPIAGKLGDVANLRVGSVMSTGDRLVTIIPAGTLQIVAYFQPDAALGRIRPGLKARLRLHGFSWTQYGSVAGTVTSVSDEPEKSGVRVELSLARVPSGRLRLQHGLPGSLEVEIERISPAALVMRTVGKWISDPSEPRSTPKK